MFWVYRYKGFSFTAARTVHTALVLSIAVGALLTVLGLVTAAPIMRLLGTPDEILPDAALYLRIYFLGMIPQMIYNMGTNILRAVGFPVAGPEVITCPTCGRTQYPCTEIANEVEKRLQGYKKSIKVAVMGCVVNGPGEAREADIGIAGGKGEAVLFIHGKPIKKLTGDNILDQFMDEIYKL